MPVPTPSSPRENLNQIRSWLARHPHWALALVVFAALGPFLAKPFNIDDPLFLWTAHQIQAHPLNPYGFDVNWYGTAEPMWRVTENPPLAGYYLALVAGVFGWSEMGLHFAYLLPPLLAVLGIHRLARRLCGQPLRATLATLFTPVFLISSTTVMCDVLMLAFWIWAVVFWMEGLEHNDGWRLGSSGLLIALAALTKYFGACLIPLLMVHGVIEKRRLGPWSLCLLIPLAALGAYQWATQALYGHALLSDAMNYAKAAKVFLGFSGAAAGLIALTFVGGCLATTFCFAPLLWRARTLAAFAGGVVFLAAVVFEGGAFWKKYGAIPSTSQPAVAFQIVFWAIGGVSVLALVMADVLCRRDARSWLLALWVLGTFLFAAFFNWTVNGRSLLPMAPAVGILLLRRLEQNVLTGGKTWPPAAGICLAASAALSLLVTRSDFLQAIAARESAQRVCAQYGSRRGSLWFQGHWGFQYYLQISGALPLDVKHPVLKPGDILAVPANNTSLYVVNSEMIVLQETITIAKPHVLTAWSAPAGAGFYAAAQGPLPFAFGAVPPENVSVYGFKSLPPPSQKN